MPRNLTAIIAGFVALAALGCSEGQRTITLRFRYEPGMKLIYDQVTKSTSKVTAGDSVVEEGSYTYNVDIATTILSVGDDSTAQILDSARWTFTMPNKDDSSVLDTIEKSRATKMLMQPNGRYLDVDFLTDESPSSAAWIKNYLEQGMPVFPSGELAPGFSWTQTTQVLLPTETVNATTTYRIKSLAREQGYDCAVLDYDGNMVIPVEPKPGDTCGYRGYDLIKMTGVTYFAYRVGVTLSERQHWTVEGHRTKTPPCKAAPVLISSASDVDYHLVEIRRR